MAVNHQRHPQPLAQQAVSMSDMQLYMQLLQPSDNRHVMLLVRRSLSVHGVSSSLSLFLILF